MSEGEGLEADEPGLDAGEDEHDGLEADDPPVDLDARDEPKRTRKRRPIPADGTTDTVSLRLKASTILALEAFRARCAADPDPTIALIGKTRSSAAINLLERGLQAANERQAGLADARELVERQAVLVKHLAALVEHLTPKRRARGGARPDAQPSLLGSEPEEDPQAVMDAFKVWMRERGISQNAAAVLIGVAQASVSRILNGHRPPLPRHLVAMKRAIAGEIEGPDHGPVDGTPPDA